MVYLALNFKLDAMAMERCLNKNNINLIQESVFKSQVYTSLFKNLNSDLHILSILNFFPTFQLKIGDWVFFKDRGAYSLSLSTKFNGFQGPGIHYIIADSKYSEIKSFCKLKMKNDEEAELVDNVF